MKKNIFKVLLTLLFFIGNSTLNAQLSQVSSMAGATSSAGKEFKKSKDSVAHSKKGSFVPVPFFVTDANMGYGLILALTYMHPNKKKTRKDTPPSITAVLGGGTSTGTWVVGAGHTHSFNDDKIRYVGGVVYANVNLDFYNIGSVNLTDHPIEMNMNGWGVLNQVLFRIGKSNIFVGPQYGFAKIENKIKDEFLEHPAIPILPPRAKEPNITTFSALGLLANYDSRENTVSPTKGYYGGFELDYNANFLGATDQFAKFEAFFYGYIPINDWLYSEFHFDYQMVGSDAPFYTKPYLELRGAPVMFYQADMTALIETQWRAMLYKNIGIIGFVGTGKAFNTFSDFSDAEWVVNYGTGLRYILTKAFNTRVGVDFAWANPNSQFAWSIVVGKSF